MDHSAHKMNMASANADKMTDSMPMIFTVSSTSTILFSFWTTDDVLTMFISCLVIIIFCFIAEAVNFVKSGIGHSVEKISENSEHRSCLVYLMAESLLMFIYMAISACLMLIIMTYNVWLILAVIIGQVAAKTTHLFFFPKHRGAHFEMHAH